MITIDDLHRLLDRDPEVTMTVDEAIKNACAGRVVSFAYYKDLVVRYRGWKPLSMKEYADKINGSRFHAMQLEQANERKTINKRVAKSNNLKTPPKK